ncbi:MAG: hypothetical protein J5758_06660, partial [Abditibacteriota bacterium]|nr:hypothetical protein [Abditibacteriota bacterium]
LLKEYKEKYPAMAFSDEDIVIYSPADWQVFQRGSKYEGEIFFSGKINVPYDRVSWRITGKGLNGKQYPKSFKPLRVNPVTGAFDEYVKAWAGGWYTVEIKAEKGRDTVAEKVIGHVGVGEIFVGAGQSNSTNWGQERISQNLGMGASTDGVKWQPCNDPMIGQHDNTKGGSYYPEFADLMYKEFGVPIGIASTGHGGSTIEQWAVGATLYNFFMTRVKQLGKNGFRAVLWHQGESNYLTPTEESVLNMTAIIRSSNYDAGWRFPWFVAKVSYRTPEEPSFPLIRAAHQQLWDRGVALEGPDTDVLGPDYRDYDGRGIHMSPKGLRAHAALWAEKVIPYVHSCIDK